MAKKRTMAVDVSMTSGDVVSLTGQAAQAFLNAWAAYKTGAYTAPRAITLPVDMPGHDVTEDIRFDCICKVKQLATTEEEAEGMQCKGIDCYEPVTRPVKPTGVMTTATADGATVTVDAIDDSNAYLVIYKGTTEVVAEGEAGKNTVDINGLASGTQIIIGDYKVTWKNKVRESYKEDVPAFKVA